jgi:hypothetical protein
VNGELVAEYNTKNNNLWNATLFSIIQSTKAKFWTLLI